MNTNRLPPKPAWQTKTERERAKKLQRKAVNIPLPQSDDADLISKPVEQALSLRGKEPVSKSPQPSGDAQSGEGSTESPVVPAARGLGDESEASEDDVSKVAELSEKMEVDATSVVLYPFQDESLTLAERVSAFDHFNEQLRASSKEWKEVKGEMPACAECGRTHPPPCMNQAQRQALRAALKGGKKLRAELRSVNTRPTTPEDAGSPEDTLMANSENGKARKKAKPVLCKACARWHPDGAKACKAPFCSKGCALNHFPGEACSAAVKRFKHFKLIKSESGEGDGKNAAPAPMQARAAGDFNTEKFGTFFNSLEDSPDVLQAAGKLFSSMTRKRPAEEESAEKAGSGSQKGKKRKTGGGNSWKNANPSRKGPSGPGSKGGRGGGGPAGSASNC